MREKILQVSGLLIDNMVHGTEIHCKIEKAIPDNAKLVRIGVNPYDPLIVEFYYDCPDWNETQELSIPPLMECPVFIKEM